MLQKNIAHAKPDEPRRELSRRGLHCKTATTGYARGSKKAMPMRRKDKPPSVE